jgi:UDP-2,3-diacylglucosamine pyrophosphatase LpxH
VVTALISDLHLGTRTEADLLTRREVREALVRELGSADQVVLLGDSIELRDGPPGQALAAAAPFFEDLGEALAGRRVILVPGNHDYQLATPWLRRHRAGGRPRALGLEQLSTPRPGDPVHALGRRMSGTELVLAYPGVWLRPDVYATHGHYLDCHNQVRTFECLALAVTRRLLRAPRTGFRTPDDYEAVVAPLYRVIYRVVQSPRTRRAARLGKRMVRTWERRRAYRGDQGRASRLRPGLAAMAQVLDCLGVEAGHVVFGHLHRAGPVDGDDQGWRTAGGTALVNTGSWVDGWGSCVFVGDRGRPTISRVDLP